MNNLFRFRLNPNGVDRFSESISKDKGLICIGWPDTGSVLGLNKQQLKDRINSSYSKNEYTQKQLGMFAGYFTRMLSLKKGDYVLITAPQRQLLIASVTQGYKYNDSDEYKNKHMAHQVKIKPIKYIQVDSLSASLKRTLEAINSVVWVKKPEQINEIAGLIDFDDIEVSETISREITYQDFSKKISIKLSGDVTRSDLLSVVQKVNFNKVK